MSNISLSIDEWFFCRHKASFYSWEITFFLDSLSPRFQDFYEQGERETLLTEVSDLRDQVCVDSVFPYDLSAGFFHHIIVAI